MVEMDVAVDQARDEVAAPAVDLLSACRSMSIGLA